MPAPEPPPQRPVEPAGEDCCGEGCVNCVFDVYEVALARYEVALATWRERQARAVTRSDSGLT